MLTVKTYLDKSPVSGIGLYANEDIPKGKIVWEYFPLVDITYTVQEWKELQQNVVPTSFKTIQNYAYKENNLHIVCTDNAQFMNHSSDEFNVTNTPDLKSMYASRNIKKGEELLCDYFEYSDADDHHAKKLTVKPK